MPTISGLCLWKGGTRSSWTAASTVTRMTKRGATCEAPRAHSVISLADRVIMPRDIDIRKLRMGPIGQDGFQFVIAGVVVRPDLFRHERVFYYRPGVSLRIEDRLYNETDSRWLSNLHLAPGLVPELEEGGFTVRVGDRVVRATFDGPECELIATVGATEPYQGLGKHWVPGADTGVRGDCLMSCQSRRKQVANRFRTPRYCRRLFDTIWHQR